MGFWGLVRKGREQAKEHNAKQAEIKQKETQKKPYRHMPTHAAIDALHSAPSNWAVQDHALIREQNRRHLSTARISASSSHINLPTVHSMAMPRAFSYSGMSSRQSFNTVLYSDGLTDIDENGCTGKGKGKAEISVTELLNTNIISQKRRLSSSFLDSQPSSSGDHSDNEYLEIKTHHRPQRNSRPSSIQHQKSYPQVIAPYQVRRISGGDINFEKSSPSPALFASIQPTISGGPTPLGPGPLANPAIARARGSVRHSSSVPRVPPIARSKSSSISSQIQLGRSTQSSSTTISASSRRSISPPSPVSSDSTAPSPESALRIDLAVPSPPESASVDSEHETSSGDENTVYMPCPKEAQAITISNPVPTTPETTNIEDTAPVEQAEFTIGQAISTTTSVTSNHGAIESHRALVAARPSAAMIRDNASVTQTKFTELDVSASNSDKNSGLVTVRPVVMSDLRSTMGPKPKTNAKVKTSLDMATFDKKSKRLSKRSSKGEKKTRWF